MYTNIYIKRGPNDFESHSGAKQCIDFSFNRINVMVVALFNLFEWLKTLQTNLFLSTLEKYSLSVAALVHSFYLYTYTRNVHRDARQKNAELCFSFCWLWPFIYVCYSDFRLYFIVDVSIVVWANVCARPLAFKYSNRP